MSTLKRLGRHARANVVAYLALFIALGGTSAYAANTIGSDDVIDESLQSVDIKNGEVRASDIAAGAVNTSHIKDGAIKDTDLATDSVGSAKIKDGSVGPAELGRAPAVSVLELAAENTNTAQGTTLHADYEFFDTGGMHDTKADTENLVAPVTGRYYVSATVEWDPSGTGYRRTSLVGVGSGAFASVAGPPLPAPAYTSQNVSGFDRLQAGQPVHVEVLQGSGGDLKARISRFQMTFLGG
jgi:hypothetical protein